MLTQTKSFWNPPQLDLGLILLFVYPFMPAYYMLAVVWLAYRYP